MGGDISVGHEGVCVGKSSGSLAGASRRLAFAGKTVLPKAAMDGIGDCGVTDSIHAHFKWEAPSTSLNSDVRWSLGHGGGRRRRSGLRRTRGVRPGLNRLNRSIATRAAREPDVSRIPSDSRRNVDREVVREGGAGHRVRHGEGKRSSGIGQRDLEGMAATECQPGGNLRSLRIRSIGIDPDAVGNKVLIERDGNTIHQSIRRAAFATDSIFGIQSRIA